MIATTDNKSSNTIFYPQPASAVKHLVAEERRKLTRNGAGEGYTMEKTVAREVYEETGIRIDLESVQYIKSQPWPFPQSAMMGFLTTADESQKLNIDTDELVAAQNGLTRLKCKLLPLCLDL